MPPIYPTTRPLYFDVTGVGKHVIKVLAGEMVEILLAHSTYGDVVACTNNDESITLFIQRGDGEREQVAELNGRTNTYFIGMNLFNGVFILSTDQRSRRFITLTALETTSEDGHFGEPLLEINAFSETVTRGTPFEGANLYGGKTTKILIKEIRLISMGDGALVKVYVKSREDNVNMRREVVHFSPSKPDVFGCMNLYLDNLTVEVSLEGGRGATIQVSGKILQPRDHAGDGMLTSNLFTQLIPPAPGVKDCLPKGLSTAKSSPNVLPFRLSQKKNRDNPSVVPEWTIGSAHKRMALIPTSDLVISAYRPCITRVPQVDPQSLQFKMATTTTDANVVRSVELLDNSMHQPVFVPPSVESFNLHSCDSLLPPELPASSMGESKQLALEISMVVTDSISNMMTSLMRALMHTQTENLETTLAASLSELVQPQLVALERHLVIKLDKLAKENKDLKQEVAELRQSLLLMKD